MLMKIADSAVESYYEQTSKLVNNKSLEVQVGMSQFNNSIFKEIIFEVCF